MTVLKSKSWITISLFNLFIVALLGVLMRYKIAYSFPWADQKNLLHAHSHFAFTGWVTMALMAMMVQRLSYDLRENMFSGYKVIFLFNLISAYGMLFSFPFQGYGPISISFSTLSIFTGFAFAVKFLKDSGRIASHSSTPWFRAALFFNVISALGAFYMAYMMATKTATNTKYLSSLYYFLHFQYNGWFIFGCMGLLVPWLEAAGIKPSKLKAVFYTLTISCLFAYFLSAIWLPIPAWIFVLVIASAIVQCLAWAYLLKEVVLHKFALNSIIPKSSKWVLIISCIAISIKYLLQLGTAIPELSKIALGFRPIIIGYLHLVLLGVVSLFLLGYCFATEALKSSAYNKTGLAVFTSGIILNEVLLAIQGTAALYYFPIPFINEALLVAAMVLLLGGITLWTGSLKKHKN